MDLRLNDIVEMKKPHPCGEKLWLVTRVGMDIKLKCRRCGHEVMLPRAKAEKGIKKIVEREEPHEQEDESRRDPAGRGDDLIARCIDGYSLFVRNRIKAARSAAHCFPRERGRGSGVRAAAPKGVFSFRREYPLWIPKRKARGVPLDPQHCGFAA